MWETTIEKFIPIFYLLTIIPLSLSSIHLVIVTVFYLVWLGNFKLLLFSFDQGPLSSTPPLSLIHFISIALLPIKTKQTLALQSVSNSKVNKPTIFALKVSPLAIIVRLYAYREYIHPYIILALYCCHVYLGVELLLPITVVLVRAILGLDLEPQLNEPYLATSLQEIKFHGHQYSTPHHILARTAYLYAFLRHRVGPNSCNLGHILGVWYDA
ncbi:putative long-chain-alcohol O-fatty-acyltransferase 1 [Forsythia ovata]|uniref:Long-chain-alcohol O-fatty-acyltransferase 1 n=1 Tax=Forsythia ovata TaxID=205694 RepID=A0ABD1P8K1_9LAMI